MFVATECFFLTKLFGQPFVRFTTAVKKNCGPSVGLAGSENQKKSSESQIQSSQNVSLTLFLLEIAAKVVGHSKTQKNVRWKELYLFFNF